ncbi:MAG: hypothetical protein ACE5EA_09445 [Nitrospirota bacterium]
MAKKIKPVLVLDKLMDSYADYINKNISDRLNPEEIESFVKKVVKPLYLDFDIGKYKKMISVQVANNIKENSDIEIDLKEFKRGGKVVKSILLLFSGIQVANNFQNIKDSENRLQDTVRNLKLHIDAADTIVTGINFKSPDIAYKGLTKSLSRISTIMGMVDSGYKTYDAFLDDDYEKVMMGMGETISQGMILLGGMTAIGGWVLCGGFLIMSCIDAYNKAGIRDHFENYRKKFANGQHESHYNEHSVIKGIYDEIIETRKSLDDSWRSWVLSKDSIKDLDAKKIPPQVIAKWTDLSHVVVPENENYKDAVYMPVDEHGQLIDISNMSKKQKKGVKYHPCYAFSDLIHIGKEEQNVIFLYTVSGSQ